MMFQGRGRYRSVGFTLIEVLFAVLILAMIFLSSMTLLQFHRSQSRKAMDYAIMHDFAVQFIELARNQPFNSIAPNNPINALFDGANATPNIRFPAGDQWVSLWTNDFRVFHPDLAWFENRHPAMRCQITTQMAGATARSKTIQLDVRWDPPMGRGQQLSLNLTNDVYLDFN